MKFIGKITRYSKLSISCILMNFVHDLKVCR